MKKKQNIFDIEKKFINLLKSNYLIFGFAVVTLLAMGIRVFELNFVSGDYSTFLSQWFSYLKDHGGLKALATYPGDYNAPYVTIIALLTYIPLKGLYLIKTVSIIFDFALAFSAAKLVKYVVKKNKDEYELLTYSVVLLLPEVILNGALWAQCDSAYATFSILALLFLLKEKYIKSFIFLGLAFSLKLQFIFILPLFIVLYISKNKFSILHFLIIPLVNFILCMPAIIAGRPLKDIFLVYFNQTTTYDHRLVLNFPNIYNILSGPPNIFYSVGIVFTLILCTIMLGFIIYKNVKWDNEKILNLGLWFIVIVTYFLPGMHERYLFVGEILAVICYIAYKKNLLLTSTVIINSIITYTAFLFGKQDVDLIYVSIFYLAVIIVFTKDTIKLLSK